MSDNRRYFRLFTIACVIASLALSLNSCCKSNIPDSEKADLVVYGNVYTADCLSNGEIIRAEAIAIKDGKFEYVGNEDGVRGYISDKTEVFRCHKSQMVLPGLTDGNAHYILDALIDAFAAGYSKDVRNSLCHMRNIDAPDYKKMAESCNIACSGGMNWHSGSEDYAELLKGAGVPEEYAYKSYPMKSFFNAGVCFVSSSDRPCDGGRKRKHFQG